jgi:ribosomal protein S27AE
LSAAHQSVKALLSAAKTAATKAADPELKARLAEIQHDIADTLAKLGDVLVERLELLREVAELREKLRVVSAAQTALSGYTLHAVEPGMFLYKSKAGSGTAVEHYACPRCYGAGSLGVMQASREPTGATRWNCSMCSFVLLTSAKRAGGRSVDMGDSGWMPS